MHDTLEAMAITGALAASHGFWRLEVVDETPSTNEAVLRRADAGEPEGLALFAEHQTAGRGRRGNRWEAPRGSALLGSMLFRPAAPPMLWQRLTLAAAVAVCEAIEARLPAEARVKWPNDILIDNRKVAGILIESRHGAGRGAVVVGIGLNVSQVSFPDDLRVPATSLRLACGHPPARVDLAAALLESLHRTTALAFDDWPALREAFARRDAFHGVLLRAESAQGTTVGVGAGLDEDGCLLVRLSDGTLQPLIDAYSLKRLEFP